MANPEREAHGDPVILSEAKDLSLHRQMSAYLYIMSNQSHTIYVGSTKDLLLRVRQHKEKRKKKAFTARYHFTRLVYFEVLPDIAAAEAREMEIKGWTRAKKVALIQAMNPNWLDLAPRLSDLSFLG